MADESCASLARTTTTLTIYCACTTHLDLDSDLSTGTFVAPLRRFVAHLGHPSDINSDNVTNFVGTNCALQEVYNHHSTR